MFEEATCKGCGFVIEPHYFTAPPDFCGRCYRTLTKLSATWRQRLAEPRQMTHIAFCKLYAAQYGHGAPGHLDMLIIAKLAELLDAPGEVFDV